ncbi:MAG: DedA family protein [Candidatus Curtissbacteria bacterium]|nr:DedA family protein [Candidatus Curtissbacteria bacterium]
MLNFLESYSYLGLFVILFLEEGGIPLPIPGDIFIATTAALPSSNYLFIIATTVAATICGSTILFTLARRFGHMILLKFSKYTKITPNKIERIEKWFEKRGGVAIVIGRLIPGLRIVTPIVAGTFGVTYRVFWLYTAIAAFIWANIYFVIGRFFKEVLERII